MSVQRRCHFIDDASGHFVQCRLQKSFLTHPRAKDPGFGGRGVNEPLFPSTLCFVGVRGQNKSREASTEVVPESQVSQTNPGDRKEEGGRLGWVGAF